MSGFTIEELPIPASIDTPGAADFIATVEVRNEAQADAVGGRDLSFEAVELLPRWQRSWEPKRLLAARVDGRIVARAIYELSAEASSPAAWITVEVHPGFRRRGIGAALYDAAEAMARADGKGIVQSFALQRADEGGEQLVSPTGFGTVARDSAGTRFLASRGFSLEQVGRMSRLELPVTDEVLDDLLAEATRVAGPDYRVVRWVGRTPPEHLNDMAVLRARMETDAPHAGLEPEITAWDAARVAAEEEGMESSPRTQLTVIAEHVPSGAVAGFSELSVPPEIDRAVAQEDTLVLREHRGHRLGMLLKLANLVHLRDVAPGHPSVTTFNAEENRFMLDVNEAVGFVPCGYEGAWKKVLPDE